jgi:hypothetical protein
MATVIHCTNMMRLLVAACCLGVCTALGGPYLYSEDVLQVRKVAYFVFRNLRSLEFRSDTNYACFARWQVDECITGKSGQVQACLRSGGALNVVQGADPKGSHTKVLHVINKAASGKPKKGTYTAKLADGALAVFFQPANKKAQEEKVFSTPTSDGDYVHLADDGTVGVFKTLYTYGWSTLWSTSSEPVAAAADSTCESASSAATEPATGISMPRAEKFGGASELRLLGVGVRAKALMMIKVNVYAVGLYVEPKAAAKALAKFSKEEPSKLQSNAAFYQTLLKVSHSNIRSACRLRCGNQKYYSTHAKRSCCC